MNKIKKDINRNLEEELKTFYLLRRILIQIFYE